MRRINTLSIKLFFVCSLGFIGIQLLQNTAFASSSPPAHSSHSESAMGRCKALSVAQFIGAYRIDSVDRYAGGITSKAQANGFVGRTVKISGKVFKSAITHKTIVNPVYAISCYPVLQTEGDVPIPHWGAYWSNFYGFGVNRKVIEVLEVHSQKSNAGAIIDWFEIVRDGNTLLLWNLHDGWLYRMGKEVQSKK
ncbi:hypothetical protein [Acidithiobacillus ferrivorans]|uniref:hypothetical protein n=1 Tax=Acidithiobacillus ferrivorans TaxID=160808 RepID=UPI001C071C7B|nr:hypothetical protein [Acidithiobacillus ferrivorans]MBU2850181.1 hypothetical protein [Acidithiobacillus ferrivorans]